MMTRTKPIPALAAPAAAPPFNFVVVGEVRSGTTIIQSALSATAGAVCHADLLHKREKTRKRSHERYFGPTAGADGHPHFDPAVHSPYQYLLRDVFECARYGEHSVGVRLHYPALKRHDLFDLLEERARLGSFAVVHVQRNPVACYVSLLQAERTKVWARGALDPADEPMPPAVSLDPQELTQFVRAHYATRQKVDRACGDRLVVPYQDLFRDPGQVLGQVLEFVEVSPGLVPPRPACRRLLNRPIRARILNFDRLKAQVPHDVAAFLDAPDLF
jgi:LPS sulfotransferase NodH